ncbi:MAG: polyphenol oxidase family protein [Treponema sp.]|nr:polyphenol oxidase family protein [Treponema sp.]
MNTAVYPFTLIFDGVYARFPYIFEGNPVYTTGEKSGSGKIAPSCFISGRSAGDMAFSLSSFNKNREEFFRLLKIQPENVYSLAQVHSRDVYTLNPSMEGTLPSPGIFAREGDGMVSYSSNAFLSVTVADCLPVFLLDTENGWFAVLHSGWKGTGIVSNAVEIMQKAGSRPQALAAVLGPCIQSCCYRVDTERAKLFNDEFGCASPHCGDSKEFPLGNVVQKKKSWYINLQAANARLLAAAGVKHIAYCTDCTYTDTRLGSFRREGSHAYTRMIALVG